MRVCVWGGVSLVQFRWVCVVCGCACSCGGNGWKKGKRKESGAERDAANEIGALHSYADLSTRPILAGSVRRADGTPPLLTSR